LKPAVDTLGKLKFPEPLTAGFTGGAALAKFWRMELGLFKNDDDRPLPKGSFVHVYVGREDHRPTEIPSLTRTR